MAKIKFNNAIIDYLIGKKKADLDHIKQVLEEYPYFQPLYTLLAKFTTEEKIINKASVYSNNRSWLKKILENKAQLHKKSSLLKKRNGEANQEASEQVEAMENFICTINEQLISQEELMHDKQDLALKSTIINDTLITEYYADKMLNTGKKQMAKTIYEKLILKIPEKKSYFEDIIEKI
jgi:hypothetical protein